MIRPLALSLCFLVGILWPSSVKADEAFLVNSKVDFDIADNGLTAVKQETTIENAVSELHATSYVLKLAKLKPINLKVFQDGKRLSFREERDGDNTNLEVFFDDPIVGIGKTRTFTVEFTEDQITQKTGEVWEIAIPKLETTSDFRSYTVNVSVPASFGNLAYVTPQYEFLYQKAAKQVYTFSGDTAKFQPINLGFGQFQVFSFTINYFLENPNSTGEVQTIAIPPDTSLQKVSVNSLTPKPLNVIKDIDGNWLATYKLKAKEVLEIKAEGTVQIFGTPRRVTDVAPSELLAYTKPTKYWQTTDPAIKALALKLKTPKNIYTYVTETLKYNYAKATPESQRLGAVASLANPENAICVEFTDLFIALARAAGIPAREINGFAYTTNPEQEPLGLVADVLHSWPEYWDSERNVWVQIDPTWSVTTGGADFFTQLDLRHFAFVIHGVDPDNPLPPGAYKNPESPEKAVQVEIGPLAQNRSETTTLTYAVKSKGLFDKIIVLTLANTGTTASYVNNLTVASNNTIVKRDYVAILPPFASKTYDLPVHVGLFGRDAPESLNAKTEKVTQEIVLSKEDIVVEHLVAVSTFFLASLAFVIFRRRVFQIAKKSFGFLKKTVNSIKISRR